ncbi:MAG: Rrf2 family transcriptional regulator [Balneolaceae bacterium]|nr:MAG: Rrf2 family transcriptional regulator [Balneolaceae bacterium]
MFSTSCHYGLQAMIYIALHSTKDKNVDLGQISAELDIPKHFLSKILQMLVKEKLLTSMKGPTGGFNLNHHPKEITLIQIIDAIDGLDVFTQCGIGFKKCNDSQPCPIHHDFTKVREKVKRLFQEKSLQQLTEDIKTGDSIVSLGKPVKRDW